jgi:dihydropteroate synthase
MPELCLTRCTLLDMLFARRPRVPWQIRTRSVELGERTLVMGILNVTPDSFSDGGAFFATSSAVEQALSMLDQGADLIDIGGESTRPGSAPLTAQEEQDRVLPVIEAILRLRPECVLSIDTYKAETARAAIAAGAEIVNDVSGFLWDPEMPRACAELRCGIILIHTRGRPGEWRNQPSLAQDEVVPFVKKGLAQSLARALSAGVDRSRVVLDPGYGFGKANDNNYPLLAHQEDLLELGQPLLAGVSRKSFLGRTLARTVTQAPQRSHSPANPGLTDSTGIVPDVPPEARGNATLAATMAAILAGASIVRVHDVRPALEAARIADAILSAR